MEHSWMWLYLLFFLFLLLPRLLYRYRLRKRTSSGSYMEQPETYRTKPETKIHRPKPESKDMMVLGAINRGVKTFSSIKKETQIEYNELNEILENLEKRDLMRVEKKSGLFGTKIEIYATDKGFKKYYS